MQVHNKDAGPAEKEDDNDLFTFGKKTVQDEDGFSMTVVGKGKKRV